MHSFRIAEQGANRYVVGEVKPFDQKNEMFKRPLWDRQMMELGERFYRKPVLPRDKPGYRLQDQSLVNASWRLENEFAQGVRGGRMGFYDWNWDGHYNYPRVPDGTTLAEMDATSIPGRSKKPPAFSALLWWESANWTAGGCIRRPT